jgi:stage II sporulation protein AA (anti-sigma F factor antagonist)
MNSEAPDVIREGDWLVAQWRGDVDMTNAGLLEQKAISGLLNTDSGLTVDLTGVDYIDSAGIRALLSIRRQLDARQQTFLLVVPAESVLNKALEVGGVPALVTICRSIAEARRRR